MREKIGKRVLEIIENMDLDEPLERKVILNANYAEDEVFSSITFVLLIVLLEDEFQIEIDGDHLLIENLSTFDCIVDLVQELLGKKKND